MTTALTAKAKDTLLCGECGAPLICRLCYTDDVVTAARQAVAEVVRGVGGRNSMARVSAAKIILAKDYLEHLSDADLLAEIHRRKQK